MNPPAVSDVSTSMYELARDGDHGDLLIPNQRDFQRRVADLRECFEELSRVGNLTVIHRLDQIVFLSIRSEPLRKSSEPRARATPPSSLRVP